MSWKINEKKLCELVFLTCSFKFSSKFALVAIASWPIHINNTLFVYVTSFFEFHTHYMHASTSGGSS